MLACQNKFSINESTDDDLEMLRKAALESLKRPVTKSCIMQDANLHLHSSKRCKSSRHNANGHFRGAMRKNLINIDTSHGPEKEQEAISKNGEEQQPQKDGEVENEDVKHKLDKQAQGDCTESSTPSINTLARSNSLNALVSQLEHEIAHISSSKAAREHESNASRSCDVLALFLDCSERLDDELGELTAVAPKKSGIDESNDNNVKNSTNERRFKSDSMENKNNGHASSPKTTTHALPTTPLGRLSPRSAAFVLQNRKIIEKRKRHYSKSRSRSPRKHDRSPSSKAIRRSREVGKERIAQSRIRAIEHEEECERKLLESPKKKSKSPNRDVQVSEADDTLDFSGRMDTPIENLFSDEESDDDSEGRFKSAAPSAGSVAGVPFLQRVNQAAVPYKSLEAIAREARDHSHHHARSSAVRSSSHRYLVSHRSRHDNVWKASERSSRKQRDVETSAKHESRTASRFSIDNRSSRAETKERSAKNSEKMEEDSIASRVSKENKEYEKLIGRKDSDRKVEFSEHAKKASNADAIILTVIDDDDDDGGPDQRRSKAQVDLRTQLSRKRAERKHKTVMTECVQQRLLHNALGAVFQESKKMKQADRENIATAPKDNKKY